MFNKGSSGYDMSDCVLYQLEFVKRFPRKTKDRLNAVEGMEAWLKLFIEVVVRQMGVDLSCNRSF